VSENRKRGTRVLEYMDDLRNRPVSVTRSNPRESCPAENWIVLFAGGRPPTVQGTMEGALLTEAKPKLLCKRQIRANLERFSYKAKPVHLHSSDYHQVYFWAMAFQQGASALTGSRA
jgi:hypothetical protein